jgi:RNA polymerase-associated protein LEO1
VITILDAPPSLRIRVITNLIIVGQSTRIPSEREIGQPTAATNSHTSMAAVQDTTPNGFGNAPTPEPQLNGGGSEDGDLFGDDEEDQEPQVNRRTLDDRDLDSGDDEGRDDRLANSVEDDDIEREQREVKVFDVDLARVRPPEGDELYMMNLPAFIGLNSRNFDYPTYEPPTAPHDASQDKGNNKSGDKFSAFSTATSTMYWRRDPRDKELMQSNARVIRWSDGSLTLQLASKPTQQYNISTSAFRQNYDARKNRLKPVPTPYDPNRDTHNYIAAPHSTSGLDVQIVRPIDANIRIQKSGELASASIDRLKAELAKAADIGNPLESMSKVRKDPEQIRREAEQAEKDAARAQRKLENAQYRNNTRRDAVLGRSGLGGRSGVGLSVGGLEDDEGMPSARGNTRRGAGGKKGGAKRKVNRHGEIYSDDEDDTMPRGRTREDEYDREDDFLADSEEEPETYEDDEELPEDEDDDEDAAGEIDDDVGVIPERKPQRERSGTPKRAAEDDGAGQGSPSQIRKKRRVIDSDEEDE